MLYPGQPERLEEERELKRKLRQQKRLNRQEARRQRRIEELEAALAKEESTDSITDVSPEDGFVYDPSGLDLKASVTAHDPAPALADPEKPAAAREKKRAKKKHICVCFDDIFNCKTKFHWIFNEGGI